MSSKRPGGRPAVVSVDPRTLSGRVILVVAALAVLLTLEVAVDVWGPVWFPGVSLVGLTVGVYVVAVLTLIAGALVLLRSVCLPVRCVSDALAEVTEGNLGARVPLDGPLELLEVALRLNSALDAVEVTSDAFVRQSRMLQEYAGTLSTAAALLEGESQDASLRAREVAEDARGISAYISDVSVALTQLLASFNEVARHAESSRGVALRGVDAAHAATDVIDELVTVSSDISVVASAISDIAVQTRMLALNATIEAARASSGGKGFAVVADEVKQLAGETATATSRIDDLASQVGSGVGSALERIQALEENAREVLDMSESVAGAVVEQRTVVGQAAASASRVADQASGMSGTVDVIARDAVSALTQVAQLRESAARMQRLGVHLEILAAALRLPDGGRSGEQMRFAQAIARHVALYSRMHEEFKSGQVTLRAGDLSDTASCFFGRWLASLPVPVRAGAIDAGVVDAHEEFHARVLAALELASAGDLEAARAAVDPVVEASTRLIDQAYAWWDAR